MPGIQLPIAGTGGEIRKAALTGNFRRYALGSFCGIVYQRIQKEQIRMGMDIDKAWANTLAGGVDDRLCRRVTAAGKNRQLAIQDRNITVTPEEIEQEMESIAEKSGVSVEEVKKHYAAPRSKEYLIDDTKEQKLYKELFGQVTVTTGDKMAFADLFKR